jgi:hypothetical protein
MAVGAVTGLIHGLLFTLLAGTVGMGLAGTSGVVFGLSLGIAVLVLLPIVSAIMWLPIGFVHEAFFSKFIGQLPAFQELTALIVIVNTLASLAVGSFSLIGMFFVILSAMVSVFLMMLFFKMLNWKLPVK